MSNMHKIIFEHFCSQTILNELNFDDIDFLFVFANKSWARSIPFLRHLPCIISKKRLK